MPTPVGPPTPNESPLIPPTQLQPPNPPQPPPVVIPPAANAPKTDSFEFEQSILRAGSKLTNYYHAIEELADASTDTSVDGQGYINFLLEHAIDYALHPEKYPTPTIDIPKPPPTPTVNWDAFLGKPKP